MLRECSPTLAAGTHTAVNIVLPYDREEVIHPMSGNTEAFPDGVSTVGSYAWDN